MKPTNQIDPFTYSRTLLQLVFLLKNTEMKGRALGIHQEKFLPCPTSHLSLITATENRHAKPKAFLYFEIIVESPTQKVITTF